MRNGSFRLKRIYRVLAAIMTAVFIFTFTTAGAFTSNDMIDQVRQYLKMYYVDQVPDSVLNQPTIDAMIKEINKNDPYTTYFTQDKYKEFIDSMNNKFVGIGVYIGMVKEGVKVTSVIKGAPAEDAGLKPGDIIMMANSRMLAGLTTDKASSYIKGVENTKVKLEVLRENTLLTLNVVRKAINAPTVNEEILDKHIGYIQVTSFGEDTASKFTKAIYDCRAKNVDGYIIDLRNNGGGLLSAALDMAGHFVGNNVALITRGRATGEQLDKGVSHGKTIDKPVIFLINEYSASASEVLSGAVKDYGKAYFIGVKSYGKGSVQVLAQLPNQDVLKLTVDKFYSPKGNTINKVGITPNLIVPDEIDSKNVAELMLDSQKSLSNNRGYAKINFNFKNVIVKMTKAEDPVYWQSYRQLISAATTSGAISFGTGRGWAYAPRSDMQDMAKMYYPNYDELKKVSGIARDSVLTVNIGKRVLKGSLNSKNIELINSLTGERVGIGKVDTNNGLIEISPKIELGTDKTYLIVINQQFLKADKKSTGNGITEELRTAK